MNRKQKEARLAYLKGKDPMKMFHAEEREYTALSTEIHTHMPLKNHVSTLTVSIMSPHEESRTIINMCPHAKIVQKAWKGGHYV